MSKVIVYARPDGGVSVVHAAPATRVETETEEQWLQRIAAKVVPPGIDRRTIRIIAATEIPVDRTFRDACVLAQDGKVVHDMAKARDMRRDQLRALRAPKLAALDVAYMRALEAGDQEAMRLIAEQKVALRDVTDDPALETAATTDALKAVLPDCLKD